MNIKQTLQTLAGADPKTLARDECKHDRAKYGVLGLTTITSSIIAFASGTALATTIVPALPVALACGGIWAITISTMDRALILSIDKSANRSPISTAIQVIPRLVLGLATSILVSKPLEMAIFRGEIEQKMVIMQQQQGQRLREDLIVQDPELSALQNQIDDLNRDIKHLQSERSKRFKDAMNEGDGSGGSGTPGKGLLFEEKMKFAQQLDPELSLKRKQQQDLSKRIDLIIEQRNGSIAKVTEKSSNGLLSSYHALEQLRRDDPAIDDLVKFVGFIILGLETAPIVIKLFAKPTVYDVNSGNYDHSRSGNYDR
jgi:Domain of unknown function (DUF4407)